MKRREFLKHAGQGTVALASAPALAHLLSQAVHAEGGTSNYHLLAFSSAGVVDSVDHRIAMVGDGLVTPGGVTGGGAFVHFDNAPAVPKPVIASGSWKAKRLLSFEEFGTWGTFLSAVVEMEINLVPIGASPVAAVLKVVCNIGPAGIFVVPPSAEGFTLTVGALTFVPLVPPLGLTLFTTANERRD
jgi:hypothetical protein